MRLVDIEKELKVLIEKDIESPDVYNCLYKLSYQYLLHKKAISNYDDAAIVAHTMAEELYLKIYTGGHISSWLGYMSLSYHAFIRVWRKMTQSEIIDISDDSNMEEAIVNMCMSSSSSSKHDYQKLYDESYIDHVEDLIDIIIDNSAIPTDTSKSLNIKLSVMLSLMNGKYTEYHIDERDSNYTRMLYNKVKDIICTNIECISDGYSENEGSLSLMQLYTLSNADIISE